MASHDPDAPAKIEISTESDDANDSTANKNIEVTGARAAVAWTDENGTTHSLFQEPGCGPVTCDVHFDSSTNKALIRLRASVALKARRDGQNIYLFIYPERIRTLTLEQNKTTTTAQEKLGAAAYCLSFLLAQPAELVGPKDERLVPKNKASQHVLDLLQALATAVSLTVYIPMTSLPKSLLISLCDAACAEGRLSTLRGLANIGRLYGGRGGKMFEAHAHMPDIEPPPYQESSSQQHAGRKRRRVDSSPKPIDSAPPVQANVDKLCSQILERMNSGFNEIRNHMQRIEDRVDRMENRMDTLMTQMARRSSELADELRDEFETGLGDVRCEVTDAFESMHDDRMYVAQKELEEFIEDRLEDAINDGLAGAAETLDQRVNDEIRDAEERIEKRVRDRLSTASFSIQWNDDSI